MKFRGFVVTVLLWRETIFLLPPPNCKREKRPLPQLTLPSVLTHLQAGFTFKGCEPVFTVEQRGGVARSSPDKVRVNKQGGDAARGGRNPDGGNWGSGILAVNEIWARGNCTECVESRESHGVKKEAQGIHRTCLRLGLLKETHATCPFYLEPPPDVYWTKGRQLGSVTQREKALPASFVIGDRVGGTQW